MSLGGDAHGRQDLLTIAVDNLDQANMVVAVASGNSGPNYLSVESPGSAARALTAGASSVGQHLFTLVSVGGSTYQTLKGDFGDVPAAGLTAPLAVVLDPASEFGGLSTACTALPAGSLAGKIALFSRGICDFTVKVQNVQDAGALGALAVDRAEGGPIVMGQNDNPVQPTIPGYMAALSAREALMAADGQSTTIPALPSYVFAAEGNDIIGDFTSAGPTDVDFRVKPDVVAPGVNVLSSLPASFCATPPCFGMKNGTSMATPHLAGSAAVVRGQHPAWSAAEVRSAIVNTAVRNIVRELDGTTLLTEVNIVGAGREDLKNAVDATVALDPVSVSFGAVPAGSGQSRSVSVTLTNVGSGSKSLALSVSGGDGSVAYSVSPASASLGAGESTVVVVTMTAGKGAPSGGHQAFLEVNDGASHAAHAALFTLVK